MSFFLFVSLCADIQEIGSEQESRRAWQDEGKVWSEYPWNWQKVTVSRELRQYLWTM